MTIILYIKSLKAQVLANGLLSSGISLVPTAFLMGGTEMPARTLHCCPVKIVILPVPRTPREVEPLRPV
jgi:hypothetical protein